MTASPTRKYEIVSFVSIHGGIIWVQLSQGSYPLGIVQVKIVWGGAGVVRPGTFKKGEKLSHLVLSVAKSTKCSEIVFGSVQLVCTIADKSYLNKKLRGRVVATVGSHGRCAEDLPVST